MSIVTNVLLSVSLREVHTSYPGPPKGLLKNLKARFALISEIDKWLADRGHGSFGEEIDAGGEKGFEAYVFAAAFNSFNTESFIAYLGDLPWRNRQSVQVFVKKHEQRGRPLNAIVRPTSEHARGES